MPRADDDSWNINESVGTTALGVAAARAAESASDAPLISDPFARVFLDAAGEGMWSIYSGAAAADDDTRTAPELRALRQVMVSYMACRTAFFDRFFLNATDAGVRQVVILAAGLDSRAWRLPWPAGTTVYEIDQPPVLAFKSATLRQTGARPTSTQVDVPVDLRHDWPTALQDAGFDPSARSAWSAEGLLPYLPAQGQDLLVECIHTNSAAGSRLAVEALPDDFPHSPRLARRREQMQRFRQAAAQQRQTELPNIEDLWFLEERTDVADWLRGHGWEVSVTSADELLARYNRSVGDDVKDAVPPNLFLSAQRSDQPA